MRSLTDMGNPKQAMVRMHAKLEAYLKELKDLSIRDKTRGLTEDAEDAEGAEGESPSPSR